MKTTLQILLALFLIMLPVGVMAEEPLPPLTEVNIKYDQLNWQTYEFFALSNVPGNAGLSYEWTVDKKETYTAERLRFFFPRGEHFVNVKAIDRYGNVQYDEVKLTIGFWSLKNNRLWWMIYLLAILLILYYWVVKIVYLYNRRKISRQARRFLDLLDEHGWVERIVARNHPVPVASLRYGASAQANAKPRKQREKGERKKEQRKPKETKHKA